MRRKRRNRAHHRSWPTATLLISAGHPTPTFGRKEAPGHKRSTPLNRIVHRTHGVLQQIEIEGSAFNVQESIFPARPVLDVYRHRHSYEAVDSTEVCQNALVYHPTRQARTLASETSGSEGSLSLVGLNRVALETGRTKRAALSLHAARRRQMRCHPAQDKSCRQPQQKLRGSCRR